MAMVVKNNMPAKQTLNKLNKNSKALSKSLKKVASGMKINSAADDASGFSISERMRVQIRALDQANANAQNAGRRRLYSPLSCQSCFFMYFCLQSLLNRSIMQPINVL